MNGYLATYSCYVCYVTINVVSNLITNECHLSCHNQIILSIGSCNDTKPNISRPRITWADEYKSKFIEQLRKIGNRLEECTYETLCSVIYTSAKASGLKTSCGAGRKPGPLWADTELDQAKKEYRRNVYLFRKCKPQLDLNCYLQAKNSMLKSKYLYLNMTSEKRTKYYEGVQNKICKTKSSKEFWSALNTFRKSNYKKEYGEISMEKWEEHFSSVFKSTNYQTSKDSFNTIECEQLDSDFNMFELNLAIKKLGRKKAPGSDGICNEVWKCLTLSFKERLLKLFNEIYHDPSCMPKAWGEITVVPIFKKGNENEPGNYRPISLINTITKLFTSLLVKRLDSWSRKNNKISEFQAGFKTGTGCVDQAFVLNSLIQNQLRHPKGKLFCLFVDLSQAFDSVEHNILWKKLNAKGVSTKFVNVIRHLYSIAHGKVRIGNCLTDEFTFQRSVLQGESLSPKLFTLFIDDIVDDIKLAGATPVRIEKFDVDMLLFADDIVLVALSSNDLQKKIDRINVYFQTNMLKVNLSKTKVIVFRKANKMKSCKFKWSETEIEVVNEYVYLGIPFYYNGKFKTASEKFFKKAKQAQDQVMTLFWKGKVGALEVHEKLFNALCRSTLFYGVVIWGLDYVEQIKIFQSNFLRKLYFLPTETPRWKLLLETGVEPIENAILKLLLKFLSKVRTKCNNSLVKNCFKRLIGVQKYTSYGNLWTIKVNKLLSSYNLSNIDEKLDLVKNNRQIIKLAVENRIKISTENVKIMQSRSADPYSQLKDNINSAKYLTMPIPFKFKRLIFQFRINLNYITYNKACDLKGNRKNKFSNCNICNTQDTEDVYHIFYVCTQYKRPRNKLLGEMERIKENVNRDNFLVNVFKNLTSEEAVCICKFWIEAMRIRDFLSTF
ncbi:unnamed protein product [Orchesella dallaii]|uniref:Reverse transcriptase domain-containing protein n=1 Tax=Orchesella dallaii TaxID=48710 RepID=A0ABP1Q7W5_9HEXA